MTSATITVMRGDEEIEVDLEGDVEDYGSYNPHERGRHIGDWSAAGPDGKPFALTKDEAECAIQALEDEL